MLASDLIGFDIIAVTVALRRRMRRTEDQREGRGRNKVQTN